MSGRRKQTRLIDFVTVRKETDMALMGLDVGTSGVKCTIANDHGGVISEAYRAYPTLMPKPGYFELNANQL